MADIGRMSLTHMEKKSVFANSMIDSYFDKADFEVMWMLIFVFFQIDKFVIDIGCQMKIILKKSLPALHL